MIIFKMMKYKNKIMNFSESRVLAEGADPGHADFADKKIQKRSGQSYSMVCVFEQR